MRFYIQGGPVGTQVVATKCTAGRLPTFNHEWDHGHIYIDGERLGCFWHSLKGVHLFFQYQGTWRKIRMQQSQNNILKGLGRYELEIGTGRVWGWFSSQQPVATVQSEAMFYWHVARDNYDRLVQYMAEYGAEVAPGYALGAWLEEDTDLVTQYYLVGQQFVLRVTQTIKLGTVDGESGRWHMEYEAEEVTTQYRNQLQGAGDAHIAQVIKLQKNLHFSKPFVPLQRTTR